jgi:DNA replication and repair protein RecF
MAEIDNLINLTGQSPVFILDDITSELDENKSTNLIKFLIDRDMQVIISTTQLNQVKEFIECGKVRKFHVKQGRVTVD